MPATATPPPAALREYRAKRNFRRTPEPAPGRAKAHKRPIFVIQEHHATRLHYDFRLEADGVLKSWAVPREPSMDPAVKRLAVHVEDHPLPYADFEGSIPEGQYGAGTVEIWDRGAYENLSHRSVSEGIDAGRLEFELNGEKLRGRFALVRMQGRSFSRDASRSAKENWLLIKGRDEYAKTEGSGAMPTALRGHVSASMPTQSRGHGTRRKALPSKTRVAAERPKNGVRLTSPDKVLFPDDGFTKADVFAYYERIARWVLPYLRDRPMTLERLPDGLGAGKPHFWQKNTPPSYPDWIPRIELPTEAGRPVSYVLVNDRDTLLYLVNQGTLTFHPWLSRVDDLDRPDFVLFDLDPGGASFADAVTVAKRLREVLDDEGRPAFVKTSGKTGLHVLVPWREGGG
jgi:bifunctional non-homologous end joining protein LigD